MITYDNITTNMCLTTVGYGCIFTSKAQEKCVCILVSQVYGERSFWLDNRPENMRLNMFLFWFWVRREVGERILVGWDMTTRARLISWGCSTRGVRCNYIRCGIYRLFLYHYSLFAFMYSIYLYYYVHISVAIISVNEIQADIQIFGAITNSSFT